MTIIYAPRAGTGTPVVMETHVELITPRMAESYLGLRAQNRTIRTRAVQEYAVAMSRGEWQPTHQGIAFDEQGRLADGQHRMAAIIGAGISVKMLVTRGVSTTAFDVMDIGAKRTGADMLTVLGEKNAILLNAALVWLWKYETGRCTDRSANPTPSQSQAILNDHPDLRLAIPPPNAFSKNRLLPPSIATWLLYEFSAIDAQDGRRFIDDLANGTNLRKGDPVTSLRSKLESMRGTQVQFPLWLKAAFTFKAWNAEQAGEQVQVFRMGKDESFPLIAGRKRKPAFQRVERS